MGVPHCPHCGAKLPSTASDESGAPETASFCPSCGRRIEGWKPGFRAALGGAAIGGTLPGSEESTQAIAISPSLLRASVVDQGAVVAKESALDRVEGEGDSALQRTIRKRPSPALVAGTLVLGGVVAYLALRRPVEPPTPSAAPSIARPPAEPVAAVPTVEGGKKGRPRRISAPPIAEERRGDASKAARSPSAPESSSAGALPHKGAAADSRALAGSTQVTGDGQAAAVPPSIGLPTAVNETLENEATPMTEAERRAEAAARADADGVRFVVRAHLAQVHACYSRAFKESSPGGRVDIGLVIDGSGKATKIRTEANTTESPGLARCLEQRLAEWDFPRPSAGEFELIYPFVFSPGT